MTEMYKKSENKRSHSHKRHGSNIRQIYSRQYEPVQMLPISAVSTEMK